MANEQQKGQGTAVVLRDRYAIYPESPLPEFNTVTAQAFLAEDRREGNQGKPLFALVVKAGVPLRMNALRVLKGLETPGLMAMQEWGAMDWPPAERKLMVVVYTRPTGGRVMSDLNAEFKRVEESEVLRKVVAPITESLKLIAIHRLTHRGIRPTNMFWASPDRDRIVLGDCATAPPAFEQGAPFETPEMAMTHPAGRGEGHYTDDFYALGASLVMLLHGRNTATNHSDEEVIRAKIERGSYSALVTETRLSIQIIELLRGLLCDDPEERWTADALEQWLGGRRMMPMQAKIEKHAGRAFAFAGKEYVSPRLLASALAKNWEAAMPVVMEGQLELWLRRSLEDKDRANAVAAAVQLTGYTASDKRSANDTTLARVCLILDHLAPVRYKSVSAMPDGIGFLFAMAMAEGGDLRVLVEMLVREVPHVWHDARPGYHPDIATSDGKLRRQKTYLDRATIGNGVERVLYELNEGVPCMSPFTADEFVLDLRDLLPALNNVAKKVDGKAWPVDRHVAAFVITRANFEVERLISDVADPSIERSTLAMLALLALVQWRLGQMGLFGLASWVGGLMQPAINSYHNRQKRRELEREIPKLVRTGSLIELARLLDNPDEKARDAEGFHFARAEWLDAATQIADLSSGKSQRDGRVAAMAQQVAALISVSIALVTLVAQAVARLF